MEQSALTEKIAAAILDARLCVHCIAVKATAPAEAVAAALPTLRHVLRVRIDALAPCDGCGTRKSVTYSLAPRGGA